MGTEDLPECNGPIKISELGLPAMSPNIGRGHEGTVSIGGIPIKVSVNRSFWQSLSATHEKPPYCGQSTLEWISIAYCKTFNRDLLVEQVPLYTVVSTGEQIESVLFLGTMPVLYKTLGTYHTGLAVISEEGRIMCFKVSPIVIGITEGDPVFDHRRYDAPPEIVPQAGIALIGNEVDLPFNDKRSLYEYVTSFACSQAGV